jgi:4-amino-4-deoxy-L-arabinose transferase-like glycosyltransferase
MHYMVLGLPLSAFEFAERIPALAPDPLDGYMAQSIVTRLVSTLMGLGALAAAFVCAAEVFGARRAVMAPLALLLTPLFVFYGKLANLDTPALCWFAWALVGFVLILRGGDRAA